jgi:hypothetical protein
MFAVSEEEAAAIRAAFEQGGELAAAVELRRRFPRHHRQRPGAGMCPDYRRMEAAAAAAASAGTAAVQQEPPIEQGLTRAAKNFRFAAAAPETARPRHF